VARRLCPNFSDLAQVDAALVLLIKPLEFDASLFFKSGLRYEG